MTGHHTRAQPRHSVVKLLVEVDQVTLSTAAGFSWAPRWQNTTKLSDHIFIFGNERLLCLREESLTSWWKTPYNVCLYPSVRAQNPTCSNSSLKLEWSFVSPLILLSLPLSGISADLCCRRIPQPNSEGCLMSDPMVCSSYKIKTNLQPQPLPPLLLSSLIPLKSIVAICL